MTAPLSEVRALLRRRPRDTSALSRLADALGCVVTMDEPEAGVHVAFAERGAHVVAECEGSTPEEARCRLAIRLAEIVKRASAAAEAALVEAAAGVQMAVATPIAEGSE